MYIDTYKKNNYTYRKYTATKMALCKANSNDIYLLVAKINVMFFFVRWLLLLSLVVYQFVCILFSQWNRLFWSDMFEIFGKYDAIQKLDRTNKGESMSRDYFQIAAVCNGSSCCSRLLPNRNECRRWENKEAKFIEIYVRSVFFLISSVRRFFVSFSLFLTHFILIFFLLSFSVHGICATFSVYFQEVI